MSARAVASRAAKESASRPSRRTSCPSSSTWRCASSRPCAWPAEYPSSNPAAYPSSRADSINSGLTTMPRAERAETVHRSAGGPRRSLGPASQSRNTRPRMRFSDDQFIPASCHVDLARVLEHSNDADDAVLRFLDGPELDRSEQLDLLGEVRRRAFRQVLHDLVAHLRIDTLEGDRKL